MRYFSLLSLMVVLLACKKKNITPNSSGEVYFNQTDTAKLNQNSTFQLDFYEGDSCILYMHSQYDFDETHGHMESTIKIYGVEKSKHLYDNHNVETGNASFMRNTGSATYTASSQSDFIVSFHKNDNKNVDGEFEGFCQPSYFSAPINIKAHFTDIVLTEH